MQIRRLVRALCAAVMVGSLAFGIPGQGVVWIAGHVLGACLALFVVWASTYAGYRKPAFVILAAALPTWALLLIEQFSTGAFMFVAAMLVGTGSCIVHYQTDPQVLRPGNRK